MPNDHEIQDFLRHYGHAFLLDYQELLPRQSEKDLLRKYGDVLSEAEKKGDAPAKEFLRRYGDALDGAGGRSDDYEWLRGVTDREFQDLVYEYFKSEQSKS